MNMNPETIIEFAIENCVVNTKLNRAGGQTMIQGFDFAKAKHLARGGVVSGEWTAQMILAFEILAEYFRGQQEDKQQKYRQQADFYFNELQKMLITSFSKAGIEDPCLPYASAQGADTGHGWRTPQGDRTGSLAATAYFLIAYEGYNPLTGEKLSISLKAE
jgi:hypothetical protein